MTLVLLSGAILLTWWNMAIDPSRWPKWSAPVSQQSSCFGFFFWMNQWSSIHFLKMKCNMFQGTLAICYVLCWSWLCCPVVWFTTPHAIDLWRVCEDRGGSRRAPESLRNQRFCCVQDCGRISNRSSQPPPPPFIEDWIEFWHNFMWCRIEEKCYNNKKEGGMRADPTYNGFAAL